MAKAEADKANSQELHVGAGVYTFALSSTVFPDVLAGKWIRSEVTGIPALQVGT